MGSGEPGSTSSATAANDPRVAPNGRADRLRSALAGGAARALTQGPVEVPLSPLASSAQLRPLRDEAGELVGVLGVHPPVPAIELERRPPEASLEEVSRLAAGIVNELNNFELTLDEALEAAPKMDLDALRNRLALGRRLAEIIGSRSRKTDRWAPVDVSTALTGFEPALRSQLGRATLAVETASTGFEVVCDPRELQVAFEELVKNAVDAGARHVTVRVLPPEADDGWPRPARPYVRIDVEDDGEGPQPERLSRAFEPFVGSRRSAHGIGLTRVRAIIETHRGTVELENGSVGARVVIRLPIHRPIPPSPRRAEASPRDSAPLDVLVVDDTPEVRRLIARVIRQAGHRVTEAEDGQDALEKLDARGALPGAVVLDLLMPRKDGVETYLALRMRSRTLPILVVSGYYESSLGFLTGDEHASFVAKPFRPADLLEGLGRVLASVASPSGI